MTVAQSPVSVQIEELEHNLQMLLTQVSEELARETKFVQHVSPLTGAIFAQTLILGWLAMPEASYTQLQQVMALRGCEVSAQALEKRMTQKAADFLLSLLHAVMAEAMSSEAVSPELLSRFEGVYLQDGSIISLPNDLSGLYKGYGGSTEESGKSALRVQIRLNMNTGQMQGPWVQEARTCERKGPGSSEQLPLPKNALYVTDCAFQTLHSMHDFSEAGIWWLTHAKADLTLTDARGVKSTMPEFIKSREGQEVIDEWVTLGATSKTRQQVRLIAFRVSDQTAKRRREQAGGSSSTRGKGCRRDVRVGKKHQRPSKDGRHHRRMGKKRFALCDWTIVITNVPVALLAPHEARALMRCRWQNELVWRLWKERGHVDIWRSEKAMRILCEVYAKLIGMIIQHWLIIVGCWQDPHRSMVKASLAVQLLAPSLALTLDGPLSLQEVLLAGKRAMARSRLNSYKKRPSTADLLEHPVLAGGLS